MLTKLWTWLAGKKTYILASFGVAVAVLGHFVGPTTFAGITIPAYTWPQVWQVVYTSGLFSFLRNGVANGPSAS